MKASTGSATRKPRLANRNKGHSRKRNSSLPGSHALWPGSFTIRTAFILGAGLGMRLRPLTEECPKPLLPVGGRPLITFAMDHCLTAGVERIIVNTHHCPAAYERAFPEKRWRGRPILFSHEPVLLDTAGGLKNIEDLLSADETLLVYNGDILSDLPLERLLEAHAAGEGGHPRPEE